MTMSLLRYTTLFRRDESGNVRVWHMEQQGDKYRTISGTEGGKLTTSGWTLAEAKNEGQVNSTTPEQQAKLEILAKYTKQLKLKYFKDKTLIDSDWAYWPMLAKKYEDFADKLDFSEARWVVQEKFNGQRCIATKDGLFSRKKEIIVSVPHIEEGLTDFFISYPNAVLDGELFCHELRGSLNDLMKIVRKTVNLTPLDLKTSEKLVRFHVYDGYGFCPLSGKSATYAVRKPTIDSLVSSLSYARVVDQWDINNKEELQEVYERILSEGHEGIMLRNTGAPYESKRSSNLLKMKPCDEGEFCILDIQPGLGSWAGKAKRVCLRGTDGKEFAANFKGTYEEASQCLLEKDSWIGKTVSISYNGLTGLGCPQFCQMDYKNCNPK